MCNELELKTGAQMAIVTVGSLKAKVWKLSPWISSNSLESEKEG